METDQQANILLVDDRPENLLALESVLGDLGCNLVKAQSGSEALRWLLNRDFAAVLLDVNMPDMDGFETATLIRQRPRSEHTPIIFVTAFGASDMDRLRGYELGAVDYMITPIAPEILRAKVRVFVNLFRMPAQLKRQADELAAVNAALRQTRDELEMRVQGRTVELAQANQELQTEIAERRRAVEEMRALSFVDDLTGLHNRRGFLAFAGQALKLARRLTRRPSLLFADLDGLKGINDSLGHHEGDRPWWRLPRFSRRPSAIPILLPGWAGTSLPFWRWKVKRLGRSSLPLACERTWRAITQSRTGAIGCR